MIGSHVTNDVTQPHDVVMVT